MAVVMRLLKICGLGDVERFHLSKWADGVESGRHCLLALLESRAAAVVEGGGSSSSSSSGSSKTGASTSRPLEMTMLCSTLSLPDDFLCDSGYLYETVFSRPPSAVVREALAMLATKAMEKTSATLRVDQINLALKQLRVEKLSTTSGKAAGSVKAPPTGDEREGEGDKENTAVDVPVDAPSDSDGPSKAAAGEAAAAASTAAAAVPAAAAVDREVENFRLQIVAELIRMHVAAANKARANHADGAAAAAAAAAATGAAVAPAPPAAAIDADTIEAHLDLPLASVAEQAEAADPAQLELHNLRLKPYLKQLNALKVGGCVVGPPGNAPATPVSLTSRHTNPIPQAALTAQLRELEESRAFIALGISKEASEAVIKKAYHSKAIKLHPDKPGGDTAKFQQLQASYHEILKKKAEASELEREMRGGGDGDKDDDGERKEEDGAGGGEKKGKARSAAECEAERARHVLEGLGEVLEQVKEAADVCARVGQLALKWQKRVDRALARPAGFPDDLASLYRVLKVCRCPAWKCVP